MTRSTHRTIMVPTQGCGNHQSAVNIIVVGGGLRGPALLEEAIKLCSESEGKARVAGVVIDNPDLELKGARVRYTWYPQFDLYRDRMSYVAGQHSLPYYNDYICKGHQKIDGFSKFERWLYKEALQRKIGDSRHTRLLFLMACFGQFWGKSAIKLANSWIINTHPVAHGSLWNRDNPYRGPVPYETMHLNGVTECDLVAHLIDETVDGGIELCRVGPYPLLPYEGKQMYFRRDDTMVRLRSQGDFVIGMHQEMTEPTKLLLRNLFAAVVKEVQSENYPDSVKIKRVQARFCSQQTM